MKRDLMIDAITCIDDSYLEQYVRYEAQMLRKKRVGFKALLISAACLVLVLALLLCSLPLTYIVFREPINNTVSEVVDHIMFPQSGDEDGNRSEALWVHWPLTDTLFDVLGAGGEHSIIEAMKQGSGGLVGDLSADLGTFLDRMYQYYLENDLSDETFGEIIQGTETERVEDIIPPDVTITDEIISIHGVYLHLHFNEQTESLEYWIHGMNGTWGEIYIPGEYKGIPVTTINEGAFKGHKQLKTVRMSDSITTIGNSAFEKCTSLESVEFPAELQSIGERAFAGCHALNSVEISSDKLQEIGKQAFENCSALQRLSIPDGPVSIGESAFAYCSALEEIEMAQVTSIGDGAFKGNESITKVDLPDTIRKIGDEAFMGCISLEKADLAYVREIGEKAFYQCTSLSNVSIVNVTSIGDEAFAKCNSIASVKLGENIEHIGEGVFLQCENLMRADLGGLLAIPSNMFDGCASLKHVSVNENLTEIGAFAFRKCHVLYEIDGLVKIQKIGASAFRESGIGCDIVFEQPIEVLPSHVFYNCEWLTSVTLPTSLNRIESNALVPGTSLWRVDYQGTVEEWLKIDIAQGAIRKGIAIYCTDGMVYTETGSIEMYE